MFDIEELLNSISVLKEKELSLYSNTLITTDELRRLSTRKDSFFSVSDNGIAIFYEDRKCFRMNYYIKPALQYINDIGRLIEEHKFHLPLIIDVVGKESVVDDYVNAMKHIGFHVHSKYHRWDMRETISFPYRFKDIVLLFDGVEAGFAGIADIERVEQLLDDAFEPFISHIPDRKLLERSIANNELFCLRQNGRIVAAYCVESLGDKMVFLHSLVVDREIDGDGLGVLLFAYTVETYPQKTSFLSWIDDDNRKSIRIVKQYNFSRNERMAYYILKYEGGEFASIMT